MSPSPEEMISRVLEEVALAGAEGVSISKLFNGVVAHLPSTSDPDTKTTKDTLWKSFVAREDAIIHHKKAATLANLAYHDVLDLDFGDTKVSIRTSNQSSPSNRSSMRNPSQPPPSAVQNIEPTSNSSLVHSIQEHTPPSPSRESSDPSAATSHSESTSVQPNASPTPKPARRSKGSGPKPVQRKTSRTWTEKAHHATQEDADREEDARQYAAGLTRAYIDPPGSERLDISEASTGPKTKRLKRLKGLKQKIAVFKSLALTDPLWLIKNRGSWKAAYNERRATMTTRPSSMPKPSVLESTPIEVQAGDGQATLKTYAGTELPSKKRKAGEAVQNSSDEVVEPPRKRAHHQEPTASLTGSHNLSVAAPISETDHHATIGVPLPTQGPRTHLQPIYSSFVPTRTGQLLQENAQLSRAIPESNHLVSQQPSQAPHNVIPGHGTNLVGPGPIFGPHSGTLPLPSVPWSYPSNNNEPTYIQGPSQTGRIQGEPDQPRQQMSIPCEDCRLGRKRCNVARGSIACNACVASNLNCSLLRPHPSTSPPRHVPRQTPYELFIPQPRPTTRSKKVPNIRTDGTAVMKKRIQRQEDIEAVEQAWSVYTAPELRAMSEARGLPLTGMKLILIARLSGALSPGDVPLALQYFVPPPPVPQPPTTMPGYNAITGTSEPGPPAYVSPYSASNETSIVYPQTTADPNSSKEVIQAEGSRPLTKLGRPTGAAEAEATNNPIHSEVKTDLIVTEQITSDLLPTSSLQPSVDTAIMSSTEFQQLDPSQPDPSQSNTASKGADANNSAKTRGRPRKAQIPIANVSSKALQSDIHIHSESSSRECTLVPMVIIPSQSYVDVSNPSGGEPTEFTGFQAPNHSKSAHLNEAFMAPDGMAGQMPHQQYVQQSSSGQAQFYATEKPGFGVQAMPPYAGQFQGHAYASLPYGAAQTWNESLQPQQPTLYYPQLIGPPLGSTQTSVDPHKKRKRDDLTTIAPMESSQRNQPISLDQHASTQLQSQSTATEPYKAKGRMAELEEMESALARYSAEAEAIELPDITARLFASYDSVLGNLILSRDKTQLEFRELDQDSSEDPILSIETAEITQNPILSHPKSRPVELRVKYRNEDEDEILCQFYIGQSEEAYKAANVTRAAIVTARISARAAAGQTDTYELFKEDAVANIEVVKPFKCETCTKRFKNKEGIRYHREKSNTTCNPNFVPPDKPPPKPKQIKKTPKAAATRKKAKKVEFEEEEDPVDQEEPLLKKAKSADFADRENTATQADPPVQTLENDSSNSDSDDSVLLWAEKVAFSNPGERAKSAAVTPKRAASKSSRPAPPSEETILQELVIEAINHAVADETVETTVATVVRDLVEEVATFTSLQEQVSSETASDPLIDGNEVNSLVSLDQVKNQRAKHIILGLVDGNFGIFPGDKALWIAFVAVWLRNHARSGQLPTSKLCDTALARLVEENKVMLTTFPVRENDAMAPTRTVIILPHIELDSAPIETVRELIRMAYPGSYVPSRFAPSTAVMAKLQRLIDGGAAKSSRVVVARDDSLHDSDYEYDIEDDQSTRYDDMDDYYHDSDSSFDDDGTRRNAFSKKRGQKMKGQWASSNAVGGTTLATRLHYGQESNSLSHSPEGDALWGISQFGRPKARRRGWRTGPISTEEKQRRKVVQSNAAWHSTPTCLQNIKTGAWDQAPLHVPSAKAKKKRGESRLPEVITYMQSENGAWDTRPFGHGAAPIFVRPQRRADGNPHLKEYIERISKGHRPIVWPNPNNRQHLPAGPSKVLLNNGSRPLANKPSEKQDEEVISTVPVAVDDQDPPPKRKRGRPKKVRVTQERDEEGIPIVPAVDGQDPPSKRKRGRPRKERLPSVTLEQDEEGNPIVPAVDDQEPPPKRQRGRPRKERLPSVPPGQDEAEISIVPAVVDQDLRPKRQRGGLRKDRLPSVTPEQEPQSSPKRRRTAPPNQKVQPPSLDNEDPVFSTEPSAQPANVAPRVIRMATRGGQDLDEIQKLDFFKPRTLSEFKRSPNPGLESLPVSFWFGEKPVNGGKSKPQSTGAALKVKPGMEGVENVSKWEQGPGREMLSRRTKAAGYGWINHTIDAMETAFDTELMKLKWVDSAAFKIEDLPYEHLDDSEGVKIVEPPARQAAHMIEPPAKKVALVFQSYKKQHVKPVKKKKLKQKGELRTRRLTAWPTDFDGVVDDLDLVRKELDVQLAPKQTPLYGRVQDGTMREKEQTRFIVAVIVVTTLTGGLSETTDWVLVGGMFSQYSPNHIKKTWLRISRSQKKLIESLTADFQEAFVSAYEAGELPSIDYDNLVAYDWPKVVDWAVENVFKRKRDDFIPLPNSRKEIKKSWSMKEQDAGVDKARETYFDPRAAAYKRMEIVSTAAHTLPAYSVPGPRNAGDIEIDKVTLARSWIKALVFTPQKDYDMVVSKEKLMQLGEQLVQAVRKELVDEKVIMHANKGRAVPGRSYEPTDAFFASMRKHITEKQFVQAVQFKKFLDEEFASGSLAVRCDPMANEGTIMCVTNLQAHGRITLKGIDVPMNKMGLTGGGYETRKMPKETFNFKIDICPTDSYLFDEDVPALQIIEFLEPPRGGDAGEIPIWYGVTGTLILKIWKKVLVAVCGVTALRAGASVASLERTLRPALEEWEIWRLMEWGLEVGLTKRVSESHEGWTMGEWWWAVVGRFCDA